MDFAKIEADKIDISSSPFSPHDLINDIKLSLQGRAEEKDLAVEVIFEGEIPDTVVADETRVRQALINVLSNAIKYTEEGRVDIKVSYSEAREKTLQVTIKDTGVGIPLDEQGKVFDPFYRAKATKSLEGSGLGLSLTKKLIEAMGGDISFRSRKGVGTEFDIFFNVKVPTKAKRIDSKSFLRQKEMNRPKEDARHLQVSDCTVLIVDDNKDLRLYAQELLTSAGLKTVLAGDGKQALSIVKKGKEKIDLVLMDLQMPVLDGYQTMESLRKKGFKKPIIAFSAHVMDQDKERCFDSGCTDFLSKPIAKEQLLKKVISYCPQKTQE